MKISHCDGFLRFLPWTKLGKLWPIHWKNFGPTIPYEKGVRRKITCKRFSDITKCRVEPIPALLRYFQTCLWNLLKNGSKFPHPLRQKIANIKSDENYALWWTQWCGTILYRILSIPRCSTMPFWTIEIGINSLKWEWAKVFTWCRYFGPPLFFEKKYGKMIIFEIFF